MSLWRAFGRSIFVGDRNWAWRRRMAFAGCGTFLAGIFHSIFLDHDIAHASMVMTNCVAGFGATLATYAGLAVADDHLKRKVPSQETTT